MKQPRYHFAKEELLAVLRLCANQLLSAYDEEAAKHELFEAVEQAVEACKFLMFEIAAERKESFLH